MDQIERVCSGTDWRIIKRAEFWRKLRVFREIKAPPNKKERGGMCRNKVARFEEI